MDKTVQYFVTNAETGKVNKKKTKKLQEMNKEFDRFLPAELSAEMFRKGPIGAASPRAALTSGINKVISKFGNRDTQRAYRAANKAAKRIN